MEKEIIGSNTYVDVMDIKNVPAKIDTGADSSAIWASDVEVDKNGTLSFKLFGEKSEFYTGETIKTNDYKVVMTRSSHGEEKIFYRTHILIRLGTHKIKALMTLSNREKNNFPILIGKRTLKNKYIVDVSKNEIKVEKNSETKTLTKELKKNPYKFHQKYFKKEGAKE